MSAAPECVRELYGASVASIERYVDILLSAGAEWGLIGPRETDRVWDRHILNSAALSELIEHDLSVVDVGSGAGLPGIPLALLRPDVGVTLLEPLLRRSTFLTQTVDELGITNRVSVVRGRAEDHRVTYPVVVCRALAPLPKLVGWCRPLLAPDGVILALKGRTAADEIAAAEPLLRRGRLQAELLTVQAHPAAEQATVVRVRQR